MNIFDNIEKSWSKIIIPSLKEEPLLTFGMDILPEISYQPKKENVFKIFSVPVNNIKVVILGQDPYPTPNVAIGRAFAVNENCKIPVSLRNIRQEILSSCGVESFKENTDEKWKTLEHWEQQGVFLLNTALTVETGKAGSHLKYWKEFTIKIIKHISFNNPCIWLLWGRKAQEYKKYIKNSFYVNHNDETINDIPAVTDYNYVLQAPHPAAEAYSGGNAGFFGCNHFKYANIILNKTKSIQIKW